MKEGLTALHAAAMFGRLEALFVAHSRRANVHIIDQYGRIALHAAVGLSLQGRCMHNSRDEGERMTDHIWNFDDEEYCYQVTEVARKVRPDIIQQLCRKSQELVHRQDDGGRTALRLVRCHNYDPAAVGTTSVLLAFGGDSRARDQDGITPIHLAAEEGDIECLKLLVPSRRAHDFGIVDNSGRNALPHAAKSPDQRVVEYVLGRSSTTRLLNAVDIHGQDALQISLLDEASSHRFGRCCPETIRITLAAGARADRANHRGRDALTHYLAHKPFIVKADVVQMGCEPSF
ncbi:hypothetical protein H2198_007996 [Neophaeococcomyces mojaviensis]|uniref:Uncharacterized protein n=1 Tax=Neophaeococcomyces mojaviensis TaxID=3383035 RepID=A0ACC2ZYU9_9EURO|nr:hypothetical protein H2198_007996 [Knufia sp. JES_112]